MTNKDSDGMFDNDWEDSPELSWTEADWEKYLTEHEVAVGEYLKHYEQMSDAVERIDEIARRMGWDMQNEASQSPETDEEEDAPGFADDFDLYTVHRNPVHIATKAIYLSLIANWEKKSVHAGHIPSSHVVDLLSSLFRGREHALQAVQSLDMGDYALALCFFKRALRELNDTLSLLSQLPDDNQGVLLCYREFATPRLFDLREIWLRVMNECRSADDSD
ncbi:MAG: hypothetical protein Q8M02_09130 [Candidatus Didemnitutus sp.]|nr:hypothetical protein [Candidatus Didemnitutus sp.]